MINLTDRELVLNQSGSELDEAIRRALEISAGWVQKIYAHEKINLEEVNTKNFISVAFSAYVKEYILKKVGVVLEEECGKAVFTVINRS